MLSDCKSPSYKDSRFTTTRVWCAPELEATKDHGTIELQIKQHGYSLVELRNFFWGHVWGHERSILALRVSLGAGLRRLFDSHRFRQDSKEKPRTLGLFCFS